MPKRSQGLPEDYTEYEAALARAIGRRIQTRRRELNLTQENVRALMELHQIYTSRSQYSRIEAGESLPRASEIIALCRVLQISYGWLLGEDQQPS